MASLPDRTVPNKKAPSSPAAKTHPSEKEQPNKDNGVDFHFQKFASNVQQTKPNKDPAVTTRVNYFNVTLPKDDKIFVYQINFPNTVSGRVIKNRAFKKQLVEGLLQQPGFIQNAQNLATDYNSNLVSLQSFQLPQGSNSAQSAAQSVYSAQTYSITVPAQVGTPSQTYGTMITAPQPLLKADLLNFLDGQGQQDHSAWLNGLNILTRNHAAQNTVKSGADKFFPLTPYPADLGHGLHPRKGFFTSIRPVQGKVVLNMHGASSGFITSAAVPLFVERYYGMPIMNIPTDPPMRRLDPRFKSITKGLRVRLLYAPPPKEDSKVKSTVLKTPDTTSKIKRINGFGLSAATQTFFHAGLNVSISVENYFNRHVLAPTSQLKNRHLLVCNLGTRDSPSWVPSELLFIIPHQPFMGQLPEPAMRQMVGVAQRRPQENVQLIEAAFGPGQMFDQVQLRNNGIEINPRTIEANARMLPVPALLYNGKTKQEGGAKLGALRKGKWDLRGKKFNSSKSFSLLGVIEISGKAADEVVYRNFAAGLASYGITPTPRVVVAQAVSCARQELDKALQDIKKKANGATPNYCLIVLPNKNAENYDALKWWADSQITMHTVCVTPEKKGKLSDAQFQGNLALKFNVKAGGRNHILPEAELILLKQKGTTMVVGADVTHPGPGSVPHCPSIAAVVASIDPSCVQFPGSLRLQVSKQEMIADLTQMMVERLQAWYKANKDTLPSNILFYRDGVSESQFAAVRDDELVKVQKACKVVAEKASKPDYDPKITLLVCGKRHHTRFYPSEDAKKKAEWVRIY
jgi:hypothetical protein